MGIGEANAPLKHNDVEDTVLASLSTKKRKKHNDGDDTTLACLPQPWQIMYICYSVVLPLFPTNK